MLLRTLGAVLILAQSRAAGSWMNVTKLTPGVAVRSVVDNTTSSVDFFLLATDDRDSLAIEMSAGDRLSLYVIDGGVASEPHPWVDGTSLLSEIETVPFSTAMQATALDADTSSRLVEASATADVRRYYGYVSTCYILPGSKYFVRVHSPAQLREAAPFSLTVKTVRSEILLTRSAPPTKVDATPGQRGNASGAVCDGKWMHHFFDLGGTHVNGAWHYAMSQPTGSRVHVSVRKASGELTRFYVRYEQCATGSDADADVETGRSLLGFGRSIETVELPTAKAGRYYVSIQGTVDLCGEYTVHVSTESAT